MADKTTDTCVSCRFFANAHDMHETYPMTGHCVFNAPTTEGHRWPYVLETEFCGKFQPKNYKPVMTPEEFNKIIDGVTK